MIPWLANPLTISRRVATTAARQQPTRQGGLSFLVHFLPSQGRWVQLHGRRTLSSSTARRATQKHRVSVLLVPGSALAALLLYQAPARMDSARDRAAAAPAKHFQPAEQPVFVSPGLKGQDAKSDSRLQFYETLDVESDKAMLDLPREEAILTTAPNVPPPITRNHPVLLQVSLTTMTRLAQLSNQYKYEQWTFNDTVPGPFIRARVGDVVELTLTNRDEAGNPHNIDCHAFTGPGGGAALTTAEEGESKTARFKLLNPGLYLYHCAAAPVPVHIANGMYGLMYVQPADDDQENAENGGLPRVDREYYVMQSEFYHEPPEVGDDGRPSKVVEFSYPNGMAEEPNLVVFNGSESALTRDKPLKAVTGETVRIFFGNAGPNLTSSFHVIGSNFKRVYRDGDVLSPPGRFVSTVAVPPGAATIVDMKMAVPGTYALVDHAIFRLDKGAVGFLNVSGKPREDIYGSAQPPEPCVGCKLHA